ncbi:MAG: rhomboid family intramembrane serine protease [Spirulinaceae cyanobacterium]
MIWNFGIVLLVFWSCVSLGLRTCDRPNWKRLKDWPGVSLSIATIALLLLGFVPRWSGVLSLMLWGVTIILPLWGWQQLNHAIAQYNYDRALKLAQFLPWLHPGDGWPQFRSILKLLYKDDALAISEISTQIPPLNHALAPFSFNLLQVRLLAHLYSRSAYWLDLLTGLDSIYPPSSWQQDPILRLYYLRALGETNRIKQLLWEIHHLETQRQFRSRSRFLNEARLLGFAFCGQGEWVEKLIQQDLKPVPPDKAQFWRLTAQTVQGENTLNAFLSLSESPSTALHKAIAWRLAHPPHLSNRVLSDPIAAQILTQIETTFNEEKAYSNALRFSKRFAKATTVLILLNFAVFSFQLYPFQPQNPENFLLWGALNPNALIQGQWWRVISANFLHANSLHLMANMLGLYLLGPFVEFSLGVRRYLGLYLLAGMGAMVLYAGISLNSGGGDRLLIGASAAIMGMLGAIAAILLRGWIYEASDLARRRLQLVAIAIGFQLCFDLLIPQVSILAHILGLIVGFLLTLIMNNE